MFASPKPSHPVTISDQFCSLVYSLANLYFVGCFYTRSFVDSPNPTVQSFVDLRSSLYASFPVNVTTPYQAGSSVPNSAFQTLISSAYDPQAQKAWSTCGVAQNFEWYYLLGVLPFLARFLQSLRRYRDSKLFTQLINVWHLSGSSFISYSSPNLNRLGNTGLG